jgi:NAD(P)-dependent dehydrogenase (short-subunit alcohol dehydrogenase family)
MTNRPLQNRVAVVTHGASEVGRGICAALERAGALVVGDDAPDDPSWDTAAHAAHIDALLERVATTHGRLDIMVNTSVTMPAMAAETLPLEQFMQGITLNLNAIFFGCQSAARQMLRQSPMITRGDHGAIINISSVAGVVALPGHAAFSSAMAGVQAMTKILATEWGSQGVRVVGVGAGLSAELAQTLSLRPPLPGSDTLSHRRIPPGALTTPFDVGQLVAYLAGDDARHITGTTVYVDGGWLADGYWED